MGSLFTFHGRLGRTAFAWRLLCVAALLVGWICLSQATASGEPIVWSGLLRQSLESLGQQGLLFGLAAVFLVSTLSIRRGRDIGVQPQTVLFALWFWPSLNSFSPGFAAYLSSLGINGPVLLTTLTISAYPVLAFWPGKPADTAVMSEALA